MRRTTFVTSVLSSRHYRANFVMTFFKSGLPLTSFHENDPRLAILKVPIQRGLVSCVVLDSHFRHLLLVPSVSRFHSVFLSDWLFAILVGLLESLWIHHWTNLILLERRFGYLIGPTRITKYYDTQWYRMMRHDLWSHSGRHRPKQKKEQDVYTTHVLSRSSGQLQTIWTFLSVYLCRGATWIRNIYRNQQPCWCGQKPLKRKFLFGSGKKSGRTLSV